MTDPSLPPEVRPGAIRLSVNLATDVAAALRGLCEAKNISITEGVRRSVAVWKFVQDEVDSGNKIYVVDELDGRPDGRTTMREVVLLS